ncbi:DUF998 domain-containing protein [Kocuria sp. SM24M-10]|uniref:DUF998 domain-containing protein n=1 Tax=Kocuria sp. SM24M-10 TaxID=1660349 RepID=UPI000649E1B2|nr:DUF998 domain-containing protein [Kocuria sp. SM24M-10]KLU09541.1 hypothetical protein ABL57_11640 [Kocuria sp. SM24M-10]
MSKQQVAGWCWVLAAILLPAQILVAARWPQPYSWRSHLISDLGATMCGIADAGERVERYVCSPWHVLANAATVVNGLTLSLGAVLLWSVWPRRRIGQAGSVLLAVGGLCVVGVGLTPWDLQPDLHNLFALIQAPLQWVGMVLLVRATWSTTLPRVAPVVTAVGVVVSMAGFALFLDAVAGGSSLALGLGLTERLAFDTLTLWSATVGAVLLVSGHRSRTNAPEPHTALLPVD